MNWLIATAVGAGLSHGTTAAQQAPAGSGALDQVQEVVVYAAVSRPH